MNTSYFPYLKKFLSSTVSTFSSFAIAASPMLHARIAAADSLPVGGQVETGSASINNPSANSLIVNQTSDRAVIGWDSFSIGSGGEVTFNVPDASSATLNRVNGSMTSTIAGQMRSNGQLLLINPNGILITPTGSVKANTFIGSSLDIQNSDFTSGKTRFKGNGSSADVINQGLIRTEDGGVVVLMGGHVENTGTIEANEGAVGLASGEDITVDLTGDGLLSVSVPSSNANQTRALIAQAGRIKTNGGRVELKAATTSMLPSAAIKVTGSIEADSVSQTADGVSFGGDPVPKPHRIRKAQPAGKAGTIVVDGGAGGTVVVASKLSASGKTGNGGQIVVTGKKVQLNAAQLDASGAAGGGKIEVGGSWQGKGPVANAETTRIDEYTVINASATDNGKGGEVVVWSDQDTLFQGLITAKGGENGGDGGNVEVSGKAHLGYMGLVNTLAPRGKTGNLLLDPYNVTISTGTDTGYGSSGVAPSLTYTASANDSIINISTLQAALASSSVTVSTNTAGNGSQTGNITIANALNVAANTLTLQAAGGIIINAGVTIGATGALVLNADGTGGISGSGAIANAGAVTFNVNNAAGTGTLSGVISGAGTVTKTGAGTLTLAGANTLTGTTNVNAGTLVANVNATQSGIGTGAAVISSGATLRMNNTNNSTSVVTIGNSFSGAGTLNLNMNSTVATGTVMNNITGMTGLISLTGSGGDKWRYSGTSGAIIQGALSVGSGTTFYLASTTLTFNGGISVVGTGNTEGTGPLRLDSSTLNGNITLLGNTTLSNASGSAILNGNISSGVGGNVVLTFNQGGGRVYTLNGVISDGLGTVSLVQNSAGSTTLTGVNAYTGTTSVNGGLLTIATAGSLGGGTYANNITIASGATFSYSSSANQTLSGIISGAGSLTKTTGTSSILTLTGTNTYSGATTVSAGKLTIGGAGSLGSAGTYAGNIALSSGASLFYSSSANQVLSGVISGAGSITKDTDNVATLTLSGTNTYTGTTTINNGTVLAGSATALGTNSALTIGATGSLDLNGNSISIGSLTGSAGAIVTNNGAAATLTTGALNNNSTFAGVIQNGTGTTSLVKAGAGTLTLSGINTYAGDTAVNGGFVTIGSAGTLGNGSYAGNISVASGATFSYISTANQTLSGNISGAGNLTKTTGTTSILTLTGANTYSGTTTLSAGILALGSATALGGAGTIAMNGGTLQYSAANTTDYSSRFLATGSQAWSIDTNGQNVTFGSALAGTGSTLTKSGTGTLTLNGANTYTGATTINNGTVLAGSATALGTNSALTIGATGSLDLNGNSFSIGSLTGSAGAIVTNNGAAATLTTGALNSTTTFAGVIQNGTGTTSLVKTGTGTLTLSGTNTYTGTTAINGGTLAFSATTNQTLSGAISGTGNLSKSGSGTLTLNGANTYTGATTISAGTLAFASNSDQTLAGAISGAGNLTKSGSGTLSLSGTGVTYTGATTITAGTLKLTDTTAFGSNINVNLGATLSLARTVNGFTNRGTLTRLIDGAGTVSIDNPTSGITGGWVRFMGAAGLASTFNGNVVVNSGVLTFDGGGAAWSSAASLQINSGGLFAVRGQNITVANISGSGIIFSSYASNTLTINNSSANTFSGTINGNGSGASDGDLQRGIVSIVKTGAGSLTLSGASTYTGSTSVNGGTLIADSGTAFGVNSAVTVGAAGTLDLNGNNITIGSLTGSAGAIVTNNGAAATLTTGVLNSNTTFAGVIQNGAGTTSLVKAGTWTLALTGTNTYTGTTAINGGTLAFSSNSNQTLSGAISGAGNLSKSGTGTLTLTAANTFTGAIGISAGTLQIDGAGTLGGGNYSSSISTSSGATFRYSSSAAQTITGSISGAGNVVKDTSSTSTLTLTGPSSYTGGTIIEKGTLVAGNSTSTALFGTAANITVNNGGKISFQPGGLSTFRGILTVNSGGVASADSASSNQINVLNATLNLNGGTLTSANGLAGPANDGGQGNWMLNSSGSTINITDDSTISSTTWSGVNNVVLNISSGKTLTVAAAGASVVNNFVISGGGRVKAGSTSAFSNNSTITMNGSTLDLDGYSNAIASIAGSGTVTSASSATLTTGGSANPFSGALTGALSLAKVGNNTLTLSGNNSYSGGTTINGGILSLGSANALGSTSVISFGGGTLQYSASNTTDYSGRFLSNGNQSWNIDTNSQTVTFATALAGAGSSLAKIGDGTLVLNGANSYTGDTTINAGTLELASGSDQTLAGAISGSGTLTKSGTGTLTLSGNNTYTGGTNINGGILSLGSANALGATGTIAFGGGTLQYSASNMTDYSGRFSTADNQAWNIDTNGQTVTFASALTGASSLAKIGLGTLVLNSANSYTGDTTINAGTLELASGSDQTLAGVISGSGTLTKSGTGTLTLSGNNTYTGGTTINGGILSLGSANALGSAGAISFGGGTLQYSASNTTDYSGRFSTADNQAWNIDTNGQTVTFASALTGASSLAKIGLGTLVLNSANSYTGDTTINAGTLELASGSDQTLAGFISGSGTLTKSGTGTLTLSGNNSYSGGTNINGGILSLGSANALGSTGVISFGGGTLQYSADNTTDYSGRFSTAGNQAWNIDTNDQSVTFASGLAGVSSLTKSGNGTLTLSGTNTYTGTTTVNAGTLTLSGNWDVGAGQATTVVNSGALLNGVGVITAATLAHSGAGDLNLSGENLIDTISTSSTTGAFAFKNAKSLAVNSINATSIAIQAAGDTSDLTLNAGATLTASGTGNAVILAAGAHFINNAGSGAIELTATDNKAWQVYAKAPEGNTYGGLDSNNTAVWGTAYGNTVSAAGNRYVFASNRTVTITSNNASKTYGDSVDLTNGYGVSGLDGIVGAFKADDQSAAFSGTVGLTSLGSDTDANVVDGGYVINVDTSGLTAQSGFTLAAASTGKLTVNRRAITVTADAQSMTYGDAAPTLTRSITSGSLVGSDQVTGNLTTAASQTANAGIYAIDGSALTAGANYDLTYNGANVTINKRDITVTADSQEINQGAALPVFTYRVTNGSLIDPNHMTGVLSTTAISGANAGTYDILKGSLDVTANYFLIFVGSTLTINATAEPPAPAPVPEPPPVPAPTPIGLDSIDIADAILLPQLSVLQPLTGNVVDIPEITVETAACSSDGGSSVESADQNKGFSALGQLALGGCIGGL